MADNSISISRDANVSLAKQQDFIGINKADWARLKRKIGKCKSHASWWLNIAFTFFGITGSALLSLFTLPLDSNSSWAKPAVICVCIVTAILGFICVLAHMQQGKFETSKIEDVKEVIEEIDNSFKNQ